MPLTPGTRLGPFAIQSLLGSGGMGEVYRARDTKLDRDVALKLLPAELAHDTERLRRFQQEARSASALNHPAIVVIYDFGKIAAQPYISMELVEGQTLRQMLQAGAMPPRRALQVAAPIADGLAKAHEAGIVHRDLKPENLMVSHDGFAKILDFGLAKLVDEVTGRSTVPTTSDLGTRAGSVIGTVGYMSPEQASGGPADYRSDQFSLGLVVFEMLTGQRAFHRPTAAETLSAIIREDPPTLGHLNPSVPAPLQWIVERCLAKNPSDRYGSTRDLARDLASARDHFSELTSSAASPLPPVARAGRVKTRELAAWSLVAALLVTTAVLALRPGAPPPAADRPLRFAISPPENVTFESPFGMSPFALSPDGRHLVFVGRGRDGRGLWLHSFDSLVSRPLAGTQGAFGAFWSPDGRAVAFFTPDRLKRVSIDGGEVATICEARWGGGGTWNRDGVIVFAPGIESALFRVAATGGVPTPITELDAAGEEGGHIGPLFLPDGRHFVFSVYGGKAMGTYVAALDAPGRTRLPLEPSLLGFSAPDFLFFMRERVLMAQRLDLTRLELTGEALRVADGIERLGPGASFAVSASGTLADRAGARDITQATWFRRDGTAAGTLGHPAASMNIAVSADGRQAAVDRFDDAPGIWLLDAARGTETRATFGKIYESTPVWSPDGTAFAYASAELAPPTLYVKPLGSAAAGQRLFGTADQTLFPQSWSPDGRLLAYASSNAETQVDIWVLDLSGEPRPRPLLQTTFSETHARISPDGRWMAYASNESGRQNVYVTRFPEPGAKWPVSTSGGGHPVWRRDGRELFYRAPGGVLMAVPVTAGADFSAGAPIALFHPRVVADTLGYGTFYDVAPDGRFLINIVVEQTSPPATVVINWRAANAPPEG